MNYSILIALCIIMCGIFSAHTSFSQIDLEETDGNYEFIRKRPASEGYTVFFDVKNLQNKAQGEQVLQDLLNDEGIYDGRFFSTRDGKDRFHIYILPDVNANYVREIITKHNIDYVLDHVSLNGKIEEKDRGVEVSRMQSKRVSINYPDYPKFEDTGNTEQDRHNYDKKKREWIKNNPEKYEKILNNLKD